MCLVGVGEVVEEVDGHVSYVLFVFIPLALLGSVWDLVNCSS